MGYRVQAILKNSFTIKRILICYSLVKDYFGVGSITEHGNTTLPHDTVKSLKDLDIKISYFDKFLSQKLADYKLIFYKKRDAILLIKKK